MTDAESIRVFRESVRGKSGHLSPAAVKRAVDWHVRQHRVGRRFEAEAVELAGQFDAQAEAMSQTPSKGRASTELTNTPVSEYTGSEWVRVFTPRIEAERKQVWGTPSAPWVPGEGEKALAWLLAEEERGREVLGIPEGEFQNAESAEIRARVAEMYEPLSRATGCDVSLHLRGRYIELIHEAGGKWWPMQVEAFGSAALSRLGRVCDEIHEVTGFLTRDVTAWLMFDVTPEFHRADFETRYAHAVTDRDGGVVHATTVTVTFRTPDVTLDDLRQVREVVERLWEGRDAPTETKDRRLTWRDNTLLRAWREAGGPGSGSEFWDGVRHRWRELAVADSDPERTPLPPASGESCRRYFYRLQKKLAAMHHMEEVDNAKA